MIATPELTDIVAAWRGSLRLAVRRLWIGAYLLAAVGALLVVRQGTIPARIAAALLLAGPGLSLLGWLLWRRRQARAEGDVAIGIVRRTDPILARKLQRALDLAIQTRLANPRVSRELAELHLERGLAQVPIANILEQANKRAAIYRNVAALAIVTSFGYMALASVKLFEGLNVFLASDNRAPIPMALIDLEPVVVQSPVYLHDADTTIEFGAVAAQPAGSFLIVRGVPIHNGQHLVLTDGAREVAFVSDAQGGVSARYNLEQSVQLRVAARLGQVLIFQPEVLPVEAIVDRAPEVELDEAPKRVAIGDIGEVELHYRASDDHGIRQIDLVLRSGAREERRTLERLDGETKQYVGAHVIGANDAFVANSFGAVELYVAARDDNNLAAAEWGKSAVVTLDQPSLGHVQVQRFRLLDALRRQLVDWLAAAAPDAPTHGDLKRIEVDVATRFAEVSAGIEADRGMKRALLSFLRAQRNKLPQSGNSSEKARKSLGEVVLALDAATEAIARRDAEQVARRIADVALEIEAGAKAALLNEQSEKGVIRVKSGLSMLAAGAAELRQLGALGADLGEIAQAGKGRIDRVLGLHDFENVQRAAAFLAERLRRPQPSFMGGGRAGVESHARGTAPGARPKASEADLHLERVIAELQQLARDHAGEVAEVEQVLKDAEQASANEELRAEARRHADEIRRIVERLPSLGAEPGSVRATLALAKEQARGSAESLERLKLMGAFTGLQKADAAIGEAEMLNGPTVSTSEQYGPKGLPDLRQRLAEQRDWVRRMLDVARDGALNQSRELLHRIGAKERELAERAMRLARRETKDDRVLPEEMRADLEQAARLMRQASEMLDSGRGQGALDQQRRAQNLLERGAAESEPENRGAASNSEKDAQRADDHHSDGRTSRRGGKVVSTSDAESREEFRRRVQKGLSKQVPPELSPAVRRYAEGLLK